MSKQDEISAGVYAIINNHTRGLLPPTERSKLRDAILEYEDKEGAVIKVDRELPEGVLDEINGVAEWYALRPNYAGELINKILVKAGYVATIPIKEEG